MSHTRKPAIAIFGPTASGKTKLGVAVAKTFFGEVISIDSMQCYKPGGIVTAKPDPVETQDIPHHLIDYLEANEEPQDFTALTINKMEDITSRKKLPVLVGLSTTLHVPILEQLFKHDYILLGIMLVPHLSSYQLLIESRCVKMMKEGLMAELMELKALEEDLLQGKPDFKKGVWKVIGYRDFHPYLSYNGPSDKVRDTLYHQGATLMHANTAQYGCYQLEFLRHILTPILHQKKVTYISLNVTDAQAWKVGVEEPALSMANQFFYGSHTTISIPEKISSPRIVCLFGGLSSGNDESHIQAAKALAHELHRNNITLVYGGGTTGIMGAIASTLVGLSGPSSVHGIIPTALAKFEEEVTGQIFDQSSSAKFGSRTVVRDMHTRKRLMVETVLNGAPGSGFVALSGGYSTMEELLEVTTWYQIGIHNCGVCVFNVNGFYNGFLTWISQVAKEGFIGPKDTHIVQVANSAQGVVQSLGGNSDQESRLGQLDWI